MFVCLLNYGTFVKNHLSNSTVVEAVTDNSITISVSNGALHGNGDGCNTEGIPRFCGWNLRYYRVDGVTCCGVTAGMEMVSILW